VKYFDAPGLTGESFYRTRRSNLRATLTVFAGLAAALYQGATQIRRLVFGIRILDPAFGLSDYMVQVIVGAAVGAIIGALVAWPIGYLWERWHRAHRSSQPAT
jgi:hypothetical protein